MGNIIAINEVADNITIAIAKAKEDFLFQVFSTQEIDVPKYIENEDYRQELGKQGLSITDNTAGGVNYVEIIYKGITSFCLWEIQIEDLTIKVVKKEFSKKIKK